MWLRVAPAGSCFRGGRHSLLVQCRGRTGVRDRSPRLRFAGFTSLFGGRPVLERRVKRMSEVVRRHEAAARCPDCGAALTSDLPEGLCPRCLLGPGSTPGDDADPAEGPAVSGESRGGLGSAMRAFLTQDGSAAGADTPEDDPPPQIPRYKIIRLIGAGGMGAVY